MTLDELKSEKLVPVKIVNDLARNVIRLYKTKDIIAQNLLNSMDPKESVEKNLLHYAYMLTLDDIFEAFGESGVANFIGIGPYSIDLLLKVRNHRMDPKIFVEIGYGFHNNDTPTFSCTVRDIKRIFGLECSDEEIEIRVYDNLPVYSRRNNG